MMMMNDDAQPPYAYRWFSESASYRPTSMITAYSQTVAS